MGGVSARSALHRLAVPSVRFVKCVTCVSEPADGETRGVEPVARVGAGWFGKVHHHSGTMDNLLKTPCCLVDTCQNTFRHHYLCQLFTSAFYL